MKIEDLKDRINKYVHSIETVLQKKIYWNENTKALLLKTLNAVKDTYNIGWSVQELNWIQSNEAVNISFDTFPPNVAAQTSKIPTYQFLQGGSLVFTQSYNGDVQIIVLFPYVESATVEDSSLLLGHYTPEEINEKLIIEKVDNFLKEMIAWEAHDVKNKLGFQK